MIFLENKKYMKSSFLEEFFVLINWNELLDIEVIVSNNPKGRISKRCFKKTKHVKFSEKRTFLIPWYAHVRNIWIVRNVCFSEYLACFVFLKHPFWDSLFCLITDVIWGESSHLGETSRLSGIIFISRLHKKNIPCEWDKFHPS